MPPIWTAVRSAIAPGGKACTAAIVARADAVSAGAAPAALASTLESNTANPAPRRMMCIDLDMAASQ
jgi:hypothetical protein